MGQQGCLNQLFHVVVPFSQDSLFTIIITITLPLPFIYLFIWLCWVFVSVRGLSLVAASGGHSSSRCAGLSLSRSLLLQSTGSRHAGSVVVAHGPSCSVACGIFPDQGFPGGAVVENLPANAGDTGAFAISMSCFFYKAWEDNSVCKIQGGSELRERCGLHRKTDICLQIWCCHHNVYKQTLPSTIFIYSRVPKVVSDT